MLHTVFYYTLNMSLTSCFVITPLLLVRLIRPLPKRIIYPLWTLAFLRLIVPFAPSASWSLFNFTGGLVKRLVTVESFNKMPITADLAMMNSIGAAESYIPVTYKTESLRQIFMTGSVIWGIVTAALLLTSVILYALTHGELKKTVLLRNNLYSSDMLLSPVLAGIFRTKIILPSSLNPDSPEGQMVVAHESVHRRRLDNLWRVLAVGITCLHWFNPLVWVMLKTFFTDMELSCDEAVIKKYGEAERKAYASALLHFAEDKRVLISSAFGRSGVKVRIVNVLNYKKLTTIGIIVSAIFLLAMAAALMTNPQLRG